MITSRAFAAHSNDYSPASNDNSPASNGHSPVCDISVFWLFRFSFIQCHCPAKNIQIVRKHALTIDWNCLINPAPIEGMFCGTELKDCRCYAWSGVFHVSLMTVVLTSTTFVDYGTNVTLVCEITGLLQMNYTWQVYQGNQNDTPIQGKTLTIPMVMSNTTFECTATNAYSWSTQLYDVIVHPLG